MAIRYGYPAKGREDVADVVSGGQIAGCPLSAERGEVEVCADNCSPSKCVRIISATPAAKENDR